MSRIQRQLVNVAVAACLAMAAACAAPAADPADACTDLTALALFDLHIGTADRVPAEGGLPAHCKVTGTIETEINFEVLLPDDWNGRFLMGGGGGFVGTVQNQARTLYAHGGSPLQRGYATAGTDTGHTGSGIEAGWALNHPTRQENFGHRAVHLTAEAAKSIVAHYYERPADYSYFVGCSRGGGQAMMESQRYPDDFDGIVAAAPAYDWTGITAGFVQNQQAIYPDGDVDDPVLTAAPLELLGSSILAACDADDGVEDGVLDDPRRCDFEPEALPRCAGDRPPTTASPPRNWRPSTRSTTVPPRTASPSTTGSTTAARTTAAGGIRGWSALRSGGPPAFPTRSTGSAPSCSSTSSSTTPTGTIRPTTSRPGGTTWRTRRRFSMPPTPT